MPASSGGEPYRVFLSVPGEKPPEAGWPLLVLTDGNAVFATARDAMRVQASDPAGTNVGSGIVAAIGYPTEQPHHPFRRSWDLSPPPGRTYPPFGEGKPPVRTGGASAFLDFIEHDLKPWIAKQTLLDESRQTLFGHSFGGLFALHVLFTRPGAFQTYVAASPSLYWEDNAIGASERRFLAACASGPALRLLLSAGEYEGDRLAPFHHGRADEAECLQRLAESRVVATAAELAKRLTTESQGRVRASFELFVGETHMSVLPVAVNRAVQAAFAISNGDEI